MPEGIKIVCSLGVFAHNESGNILALLESLCGQILVNTEVAEIVVVSSASTDGTDEMVETFAVSHPKVKLIKQAKREGKSAAINLFLAEGTSEVMVVISGDVIPAPTTIEQLVSPFSDPCIGATGGRPVPVNDPSTFMGYAVHLLWRLHHRMAMLAPKLGEMIAFRRVMDSIPRDSAVDEASIEAIVRGKGLELRYIPTAIISNKGPQTLRDFIKQRRRIQNGHLWLKHKQGYTVVSQNAPTLRKILLAELREYPSSCFKLFAVMGLEFWGRLLGGYDYYIRGRNPFAWEIVKSAKKD